MRPLVAALVVLLVACAPVAAVPLDGAGAEVTGPGDARALWTWLDVPDSPACDTACWTRRAPDVFGGSVCRAGACRYSCEMGMADCDGMDTNGCEADLTTDPMNCGACGNRCARGCATVRLPGLCPDGIWCALRLDPEGVTANYTGVCR